MTRWKLTLTGMVLMAATALAAHQVVAQRSNRPRRRPGSERRRVPDKLKEGDMAPDFALKSVDGKKTVKLSSFRNKRPVVLIFGSYT